MRTNLRNKFGMKILLLVVAALLASASLGGGVALAAPLAAPVTVDLCATAGSATMPDGTVVDVWGYVSGDCTGSPTVTQPGGPTIDVNQGDEVTVNLYNNLGEDTALLFQGQALIPDLSGAADGAMTSYTFTAANPGTYLYEAGLLSNAQHQVAMGLYGALVVRPATAGQAYDDPATAYEDEAVLVLSEIDPALNANPAGFDMRNYQPRYRLINGVAYPDTAEIAIAAVGDRVLLRYVNAGLEPHSMGLLGLHQTVIANDGSPLLYSHTVVADTLAPGETQDTIATIPLTAASGSKFALYDASLLLRNSSAAGAGGMLTFLALGGALPGGDGPITSAVTVGPSPTNGTVDVTLSATITAGTGLNVTAAEYFVDATGADGAGCPFTVASANMVNVSATIPTSGATSPCVDLATLTSGSHTFYVHGQDDATTPQWGPFSSAVLNLDKAGPATSGLTLAPNPSNGSTDVALSGTASDSATGGSNIAAAEYTIDGGLAVGMNVNAASPIANITASIPAATIAALTDGPHVISVRSQDALGNWGDPATINLIVDTNGPTTSGVTATPNPTNGMIGFNSSTAAVRVTAAFADTLSKISAGEGFIDTVGADGTGFIFLPSDGAFNSLSESGYVDIPLTTINALGEGTYPIYVHGKDAAGNWGTTNSVSLVVDKTAPTISAVTLTPNTIAFGLGSVNLAVTASDAGGTGVIAGQYWIDGTATPPANATAFAGTSTAIDTSALAGGVHTVYVRVQDAAMNWSAVSSATLTVVQAIDDALTVTANTQASQQIDIAAPGLLANDEPIGAAGRTAALATVPIRVDATGNLGTITVTCPPSSADGVCADGSFRITLNADPGAQGGNARRASKRGTFEFTYTETLNGVPSTATVTITVN
jgi:FtsP/CotA-like multicopper oxidase with cupredoxin domain